jgi:glycosyltransferase involved in cell wall biosynthesis
MKVYLRPRFFGGVGGEEHFCKSFIESCPDWFFQVHPAKLNAMELRPTTPNWEVVDGPRNDVDLYWQITDVPSDPFRKSPFRARCRVLTNAGNALKKTGFDVVVVQSPTPKKMPRGTRVEVVPSPVARGPVGPLPNDLPKDFVLTVFNPYGRVKGAYLPFKLARRFPLVWCMDDGTFPGRFDAVAKLAGLAGIRVMKNAPRETLWALYGACSAYLCCSYTEGFGWSIAEAALMDAPIASRRVGIAQLLSDVDFFDQSADAAEAVERALARARPVTRDLTLITAGGFRTRVEEIVAACTR